MKQAEKLTYMDGLKAISTILVFHFHFICCAFYCGIYSLNPQEFHTEGVEYLIGTTPLNMLTNGKLAVHMFMALSGFLAGYRFFLTGERKVLVRGAVRKYFRLVFPILAVNIAVFLLMWAGAYRNAEAAAAAGSTVFFGNYNQMLPDLWNAVKEAVWGCFVTGANKYNGPIWFIYYEFWGTLLIAAILFLFGKTKFRYAVYVLAVILCIRSDYLLSFILGMVVCDFYYSGYHWMEKIKEQKWLMWCVLLAGLLLGSYPALGTGLEGTMYQYIPPKVMFYYSVGMPMVLFAVMNLKPLQKLLSWKGFSFFTKYSYGFYLVHFPVLCTFSSGFYLLLHDRMNYHVLAVINYVLTVVISFGLSWLLTKFVERPGIKLTDKICAKLN